MKNKSENENRETVKGPGSMPSFNNRQDNSEGQVEEVVDHKDESQSYQDYNGNSEANAPARTREGE
jgi:hypothetical protein